MGKLRPRYNEKARASSHIRGKPHPNPRGGKAHQEAMFPEMYGVADDDTMGFEVIDANHKRKRHDVDDTNVEMIIPENKAKEAASDQQPPKKKMSAKKKKRLDAFIAKQIKKEERVKLMEQLSTSAFSSELLVSSKHLGQHKETSKEQLRRALLEERKGIKDSDHSARLYQDDASFAGFEAAENGFDAKMDEGGIDEAPTVKANITIIQAKKKVKKFATARELLSGIKPPRVSISESVAAEEETSSEFDSSDSQYDTESDDERHDTDEPNKTKMESAWDVDMLSAPPTANVAPALKKDPKSNVVDATELKTSVASKKEPTVAVENNSKAFYVIPNRDPIVQHARLQLPVTAEEQVIMEAIRNNPVVIICGETGSGKTTQVPQFLYEAGYGHPGSDNPGMIGVTQPRRVAAISMSQRVAHELNVPSTKVSYQIRYDATVSPETSIKFMTDGVLLRELSNDFLLRKYSCIIVDEAHERSLNTDIAIGVLSRVQRLRQEMAGKGENDVKPLKLVVMSATLRVADFTENTTLFPTPPPIISVQARQYPVQIHFNRKTPRVDHVSEAFSKVCKIHKRLPEGGILVFLTGQNEIMDLCRKLTRKFSSKARFGRTPIKAETEASLSFTAKQASLEVEELDFGDSTIPDADESAEMLEADSDDDENRLDTTDEEVEDEPDYTVGPLHVLPLYSLLSTENQMKVFQPPPTGSRLCVVATNVAETSITIPGIKYVVDCGKVKERVYDIATGVQKFCVSWISKASADQRSGRAGRVGPGHCYRLYSSAVFENEFDQFSKAEILRMPLEGVVLQMKSMNIDNILRFPFPTPPDRFSLRKAEKLLVNLGALDETNLTITAAGQMMSLFPVAPRFAKMLAIGDQHGCLPYVITLVAALSVGDPFMMDHFIGMNDAQYSDEENGAPENSMDAKERRKSLRKQYYETIMKHAGKHPTSDILKILNIVGAFEYACSTGQSPEEFCAEHHVRLKALQEIRQLRVQLAQVVQTYFPSSNSAVDPKMPPPSRAQCTALRQILLAAFIDQIAIRADIIDDSRKPPRNSKFAAYRVLTHGEDVFIHPSSILSRIPSSPEMLIYGELLQTEKKHWMKYVSAIERSWVSTVGKSMCTFGKPLDQPLPRFNADRTEMEVWCPVHFGPKLWPLPAVKVKQKRDGMRWVFERVL